jgi:MFS family permease
VLAAFVAAAALLGAFVAWERRTLEPMLPLTMFGNRTFASASAVSFFMYGGLFGALFLMSQLLQNALGYGPLAAGVRLLPWTVTPMVIAPIAGALADRVGNRRFMVAGLALQAVGYAWVALIAATDVGYVQLGLAFTVAGTGTSLCFPTVANAVMSAVPAEQAGVASGTNSALRVLGGVVGVSVLAAVFASHGGYVSPAVFIEGFKAALWVAVGLSALGIVAALLAPRPRAEAPRAPIASDSAA